MALRSSCARRADKAADWRYLLCNRLPACTHSSFVDSEAAGCWEARVAEEAPTKAPVRSF